MSCEGQNMSDYYKYENLVNNQSQFFPKIVHFHSYNLYLIWKTMFWCVPARKFSMQSNKWRIHREYYAVESFHEEGGGHGPYN